MFIPSGFNLFVVDIEYCVALEKVEPLLQAHIDFLDECYAQKKFLVSGPKVPRSGGVIVAMAQTKEDVEQVIQKDPFYQEGVADYKITEFVPRTALAGLKDEE